MNHNCRWCEVVLILLIVIWTLWTNLFGISSKWVVLIAAIILLIHELGCKSCPMSIKSAPKKKAKKKK